MTWQPIAIAVCGALSCWAFYVAGIASSELPSTAPTLPTHVQPNVTNQRTY